MKKLNLKLFYSLAIIILLGTFVSKAIIVPVPAVSAHGQHHDDDCGEKTTIEKTNDYSDSKVVIDFINTQSSGNPDTITVSANSGYKINKVWLDVNNDNHSGYFQYGSGPLSNFNPNPGTDIEKAKVEVEKICVTPTPTLTPTATPTPTVSPTPTVTVTPTPTVSPTPTVTETPTPTVTPTITPTPTEIVCPDNQSNQNGICISCDGGGDCEVVIGTPTPTPTVTETPTPTPDNTSTVQSSTGTSDGKSDGRSDGLGGKTQAGEVLGASTMAQTGDFGSLISKALFSLGLTFTTLASAGHATKEKIIIIFSPAKIFAEFEKISPGESNSFQTQHYFLLGLLFFAVWGIREVHLATRLSFNTAVNSQELGGNIIHPIKISLPSIQTELPVEETVIENGIWQISDKGVSHLATSAYPGNPGNIILYGHNTNDRLGRLTKIKKGDIITITSKNGRTFEYKVATIEVVKPTDVNKLTAFNQETLTIYTCTGFADLKRVLVKAERI